MHDLIGLYIVTIVSIKSGEVRHNKNVEFKKAVGIVIKQKETSSAS